MTSVCAGYGVVVGLPGLEPGPHPYQLNSGNRCADRRFPRSPTTVDTKGMRSIGPLVCVHLLGIDPRYPADLTLWYPPVVDGLPSDWRRADLLS